MNTWLVIALSILAAGVVLGIISELVKKIDFIMYPTLEIGFVKCLSCAVGICAAEAVMYGFSKLIPWVMCWNTELIVKISFLAMPVILLLGCIALVVYKINNNDSRVYLYVTMMMVLLIAQSGIICGVFAWIPSTAWQIGILVFSGVLSVVFLGILILRIVDVRFYQEIGSGYHGIDY